MLHSLLVAEIPASEKKRIVHEEYGIPINREFDKEVDVMCNISSLYINRGIERGIEKGRAEGRVEGKAEGRAEGRVEGRAEGSLEATIKMIKEMFKNNIPIQTIADVVHLSVEETEKIINDNT